MSRNFVLIEESYLVMDDLSNVWIAMTQRIDSDTTSEIKILSVLRIPQV